MKKAFTLCLCLCLALSACGGETGVTSAPSPAPSAAPTPAAGVETGPFTLPRTEGTLHPMLTQDRANVALSGLIWEGLFTLDRQFQPQNCLCTGYTVAEDGLAWTFTLDAGAQFSDGSPLAAADVAASLERALRPDSRYAARLANVERVTAGEDGSVTLTLKTPNGALPALLDVPIIKNGEGETPLGTGPYVLSADESALTPHSAWWRRKGLEPTVKAISLTTLAQADDLIYAFNAGELSLVTTDLTGSAALGLVGGSHELVDYLTTTLIYLGCNTRTGLCREGEVRRAVQYAADRRSVCGLLEGHATPAVLPVHPVCPEYDSALVSRVLPNDRAGGAQAEEALQAAGWTKGESGIYDRRRNSLTLRLLVNQESSHKVAVAQDLAETMETVGIELIVEKEPWNDYVAALAKGDFDLYLGEVTLSADFDITPLVGEGEPLNYGGFRWSREGAELLEAWRPARGETRKAAAAALYTYLLEEAPVIPLCFKNNTAIYAWGAIQNMTPTQQNIFYDFQNWTIP